MKKITYTKKDIVDKIKLNCNMSTEESKVMLNVVLLLTGRRPALSASVILR